MTWPAYGLFVLFPVATVLGAALGGAWTFLAPALAGLAVPALDLLLGHDEANPEDDDGLAAQARWRLPILVFALLHVGALAWAAWWVGGHALTGPEWFGIVLAVGVVNGGLAINVAHELCHRNTAAERGLAQVLWLTVGYMHFHLEHRLGHHARVATPEDPATARLGESVYAFWGRSVVGGWRSAWALEAARLAGLGLPGAHWRNQMLWYAALPPALALGLGLAFGPAAALLYGIQAVAAILVLETVNYVEHYGLERRLVAPGVYERVGPRHSWNSHRRLTNWLLLKLQRHSDHHVNPGRRYQTLRAVADVPMLPLGYGWMVPLALVPPLWRRVMDPLALAWRDDQEVVVVVPAAETDCAGSASTLASNA